MKVVSSAPGVLGKPFAQQSVRPAFSLATIPKWLLALPLPIVLLTAWQLATAGNTQSLIPPPTKVVLTSWDYAFGGILNDPYSGTLFRNAVASIERVLSGFGIALAIAIPLGLILGRSAWARAFIDPTLQFLRPIPVTAWLPLTMILFGLGPGATIALIVLGTFFPMLLNTVDGVRLVEPRLIEAAEMLGTPKAAIFSRIILPAASPSIFTRNTNRIKDLVGCSSSSVK